MAYTVQMPALGESVTEGTITRWLKQEGDHVDVDEPLLEVSTDKVDTEIPSPQAGILQRIVAGEDDTVEIGGDLAVIGDESEGGGSGESAGSGGGQQEQAQPEPEPEPAQQESAPEPQQPAEPEPAAASGGSSGGSSSGGSAGGSGTQVEMPALGESVTEGTITRWLKQVGDSVEVDEPLLEVSTDKVDTEIPSPVAGTLLEIRANEDDTVEVGGVLAVVGSGSPSSGGGGAPSQPEPQQQEQPSHEQQSQEQQSRQEQPSQPEESGSSGTTSDGAVAASGADDYVSHEVSEPVGSSGPANAGALESQSSDGGASTRGDGNGQSSPQGAPYVTPLVRKLAAERGVDLSAISGTGVGGRIRKQDVVKAADEQDQQRAAASSAPAETEAEAPRQAAASGGSGAGAVHGGEVQRPAGAGAAIPAPDESGLRGTTQKLSRRRATIAKRMVESLQTSAQLTTVVEADLTRIARLRERAKADFARREGVKLSFLPFMALATVEALKAHPGVNSSIDTEKGEVTYHGAEHLGIAVDSPAGLIVPVIHDAGDLNLGGLARKIADVADRTRANKIAPDELSGGTFTITNTGSRGALIDTPIINQPQVGILGTGAVVKKPVVVTDSEGGESIAIRSMAYLCLSYDHRIVDGADAARFLGSVKARLEAGAFEADLGLV
jgi:pyruvate dehydrogenase E2 component (dihydrolipoamide acetyltransferase)